nr:2-hydroxyacid dehydrogenase [Pseudomonas sp.]
MTSLSPTIVQIGPLSERINHELSSQHRVLQLWRHTDPAAALAAHAHTIRIAVTSASHGCSAQMIEALPQLQAICSWGVGYEKLDVQAARARSVQVSNTPDVLNDCVADLAWALILATARRVGQAERYVRRGSWGGTHDGTFPLGNRVSGKRLGILGLGRIGAAIARRGTGFDMDIRYHNRKERPDAPWRYEPSLRALAEWADFLVVACVGGAATHHLVNAEVIEALGVKGTLVNIARGPVVDEQALVRALQEGTLGAAGLDVFEHEPHVPPALLDMDNVVLMPHQGSATVETRRAMEDLVLQNLDAFLRTGKVLTPVWE